MTARYDLASYTHALKALLPRGRAWNLDPDSDLSKLMGALATPFRDNDFAANDLLVDAFPSSTVNLLPEWESTLGLPDTCVPDLSPTLASRQSAVVAALTNVGGQNQQRYKDIAAKFGLDITITQFAPSRFGVAFGQQFGGEDWAFTWQVNIPFSSYQSTPLTFGQQFGQPFSTLATMEIYCALSHASPAHTNMLLGTDGSVGFLGVNFVLGSSVLG